MLFQFTINKNLQNYKIKHKKKMADVTCMDIIYCVCAKTPQNILFNLIYTIFNTHRKKI